jgi:hypothetical protein
MGGLIPLPFSIVCLCVGVLARLVRWSDAPASHTSHCLSQPPVASLTIFLNSCGHETSGWPELYNNDSDFSTAYQTLSTGKIVHDFHLQDGFLFHISHIFFPSIKHAKLIWEAHYRWEV